MAAAVLNAGQEVGWDVMDVDGVVMSWSKDSRSLEVIVMGLGAERKHLCNVVLLGLQQAEGGEVKVQERRQIALQRGEVLIGMK
ncbi:hypothetical protein PG985_006729 [Apiospora marii]|uniref:Uncharacterized protein n=1 Tax=Apiospora marii TaxID=335849 RepID=A0ABR1SG33_9PEZI